MSGVVDIRWAFMWLHWAPSSATGLFLCRDARRRHYGTNQWRRVVSFSIISSGLTVGMRPPAPLGTHVGEDAHKRDNAQGKPRKRALDVDARLSLPSARTRSYTSGRWPRGLNGCFVPSGYARGGVVLGRQGDRFADEEAMIRNRGPHRGITLLPSDNHAPGR
jgi:hypothetical protein